MATDAVPEQMPAQAWDGPLGDLYRTDHNRFLGLAYVFLGSRSAAEDAVQEAFMAVAARASEIDKLEPYLRQAVVNRCRSVLRRRATAERHAPDPPPPDAPSYLVELRDVLLGLTWEQRAVVVLRYLEGVPDEEIAEIVGCTRSTVRSHAARGLTHLREELS